MMIVVFVCEFMFVCVVCVYVRGCDAVLFGVCVDVQRSSFPYQ